jgi:predicted SprT family Zn-dependent metalloprotease
MWESTLDYTIQKQIIKELAKQYGVKVHFRQLSEASGLWVVPNNIFIGKEKTGSSYIEIFFHELGHYHAYKNNKFPIFHGKMRRKESYKNLMITAYRAERWVDEWGRKECKKHFPNLKWVGAYRTRGEKKWLYEGIRKEFFGYGF